MKPEIIVGHFSLIRSFHLADVFTLANGGCGIGALLLAVRHAADGLDRHLYVAGVLIVLALVFDVLDGRIARWRGEHSAFGRELDSLADIVSFGAAPAALGYAAGLGTPLDVAILVFFALCGLSRLARYNVTATNLSDAAGKLSYFEGTPIPTSVLPLALLLGGVQRGTLLPATLGPVELHLLALPFAISGCLMVSRTLHIPKP
ncbi:MAG: CDP-alcohol phosphatidyltransferase family protein [Gammaproteobacteria bacterium]|nr:CDP-alcohol phosphatidyltransferase family protein [Gammaproteobacteria bacterium]MBI5619188.1 CDP-alcohol phosphatidyltransferase family protein [Gammaproteobacteria bacterium]